ESGDTGASVLDRASVVLMEFALWPLCRVRHVEQAGLLEVQLRAWCGLDRLSPLDPDAVAGSDRRLARELCFGPLPFAGWLGDESDDAAAVILDGRFGGETLVRWRVPRAPSRPGRLGRLFRLWNRLADRLRPSAELTTVHIDDALPRLFSRHPLRR